MGQVFVPMEPSATDRPSRRVGRGLLPKVLAILLLVTVAGCSSSGPPRSVTPAASPSVKDPTVTVAATGQTVSYVTPVRITVTDGEFTAVHVDPRGDAQELTGAMSGNGTSWVSQAPPKPSSSYQVVATVKDAAGKVRTTTVPFTVAQVPEDQKVSFAVTPNDGTTVGIGQPIDVRFLTPITQRAAMERVMLVDARTPPGQRVSGSWHWLSSLEVHWRPESFWTPGTTVHLDMRIAGVQAATNRYGRQDYSQTFTIGSSHITYVDASSDRARVTRDGTLMDTWPTATGRPGLQTYSGTYVVLGKSPSVEMDSCSARVTCDKKNPDYYDEKELWATRLTNSGTFVHAASWDGQLGRANTSHGCIHLSDANAQDFYNHAVAGDVVIVSNTGRGPQDRINTQDPGLYDWNLSWSAWQAGSALH
jgi:lipoprotein-anchoring transpeptidase ErfK/SrfK